MTGAHPVKRSIRARIASHLDARLHTECLWISPNAQHTDLFGGVL